MNKIGPFEIESGTKAAATMGVAITYVGFEGNEEGDAYILTYAQALQLAVALLQTVADEGVVPDFQ